MNETMGAPVVVEAQVTDDAGDFAFTIRLVAGSAGQAFIVRDHHGSPIFSVGAFGGPVVWGDRLGASPRVFGPELVIDGGISVPALAYLTSADLGNYSTVPHHWVCQSGAPTTTLANLTNNLGDYFACRPGDRYSRIDTPTRPGAREYICVTAGEAEAGRTAGRWDSLF
ncbi:MAG: hypothetical protein ACLPYY_19530 [Acidimicrobiales bacterium]